jgi:UTP--glucose-1-phosphate uridylyltransferase
MEDAVTQIRVKMESAGLSSAAVRAFLYQYEKLAGNETGAIAEESISPVKNLPSIEGQPLPADPRSLTAETVVLKLNGGLGTGMGLEKAKSLLRVRDDLTFLDIIVRQSLRLDSTIGLLFMNSYSTSADTLSALAKYSELGATDRLELMQNKVPKIEAESLRPITWPDNPSLEWCPPGHGDLYPSMLGSGLLLSLLKEGKKYLFVSNADNLGATLDLRILNYFAQSEAPFLMEVTRRTGADRKGGHLGLRKSDDRLLLRESAQCPEADLDLFQDIERHIYFNTNSLWIRLESLKTELGRGGGLLPLPLIRNVKTVDPRDKKSPKVYQLETAMGAAIECFEGAIAVEVPRTRFAPVKTTADLLSVRSDAYDLDDEYRLLLSPERKGVPPMVKLDERYKLMEEFEQLIAGGIPSLVRCHSLGVEGDLKFGPGVEIVGDVTFVNHDSGPKVIASGQYQGRVEF